MDEENEELIFDLECSHCKKFFNCRGRPKGNVDCNSYEQRNDDLRKE